MEILSDGSASSSTRAAMMAEIDMLSLTFDNGPDPDVTPRVLDVLAARTAGGYSVVLWDRLPRDWEDPDGWVERALTASGSVLVLHDVPTGAMDRLETFLDRAQEAGI